MPRKAVPFEQHLVERPNGCIEWTGCKYHTGYGVHQVKGKQISAHRQAWINANGPIPDGLCVLHKCDNPPCCNPEHLFLGTKAENNWDRIRKGRTAPHFNSLKTHCPQGHEYDKVNKTGHRLCSICRRAAYERRRARLNE